MNKDLIPISIVAAAIIIAAAFLFVSQEKMRQGIEGELPAELAAQEAIIYINQNLLVGGVTASLVEVSDEGSIYRIILKIEEGEEFLGEFESYVSKDGKFLFPDGGIDMKKETFQETENEAPSQENQSLLPQEQLDEFIACLARSDFLIYGADWCGWTQSLVTMLGGRETVSPVYVECTQEEDLCQEKKITGYPTILINDQRYEGSRSFEGFSQATGCQIPEGTGALEGDNPASGC